MRELDRFSLGNILDGARRLLDRLFICALPWAGSRKEGSASRRPGREGRERPPCWLEHAPVAEQRIEDTGQTPGERDDGDVLATVRGDAERPGPERFGLGRPAPEDGDGGLDQEPAHAAGASLGDPAPALGLARAGLAEHEAEVGLDLMRAAEAVRVHELGVEVAHDREQGGDLREHTSRLGQGEHPRHEPRGTPGGHAVAVLAEERPDQRDVAGASGGVNTSLVFRRRAGGRAEDPGGSR